MNTQQFNVHMCCHQGRWYHVTNFPNAMSMCVRGHWTELICFKCLKWTHLFNHPFLTIARPWFTYFFFWQGRQFFGCQTFFTFYFSICMVAYFRVLPTSMPCCHQLPRWFCHLWKRWTPSAGAAQLFRRQIAHAGGHAVIYFRTFAHMYFEGVIEWL